MPQLRRPAAPEHRQAHHEYWRQRLRSPLLLAACLVVPVIILESSASTPGWEDGARDLNWAIWAVFVAEFLYLLYTAPERGSFARRHWYDVALIALTVPVLPLALQGLRVLRLLSVLELGGALEMARTVFGLRGVRFAAVITALVVFGGGAAFAVVEGPHHTPHPDTWDGIWWSIVTITTVGYGDYYPVTVLGRIIAIAVMFSGIGFVATITASVANHLVSRHVAKRVEEHVSAFKREVCEHFERHTAQIQRDAFAAAGAAQQAAAGVDSLQQELPHPELVRRLDELGAQLAALQSSLPSDA